MLVCAGILPGGVAAILTPLIIALLIVLIRGWLQRCRPTICQVLRALLAGAIMGSLILFLLALFGLASPKLIASLIIGAGVAAAMAVIGLMNKCYQSRQ